MRTNHSHTAPNPELDASNQPSHAVQFYGDDSYLLEEVSRFIGSALGAGNAAVVIATRAHQDGIAERLQACGLDIHLAIAQGRYVDLDAAETLAKLLVDGWPDARRFAEVVGRVIEQVQITAQGKQRQVAAFGEMVALLWAEGKHEAAIRLEQLWNDLAKAHSFTLRCGYPMAGFSEEDHAELIQKVCAVHSHVIPSESYVALVKEEERLLNIVYLQQKAQALQREMGERKKAQQALQLREAELADFLENAVIGMHWLAADGTILWANKAELDLLGYSCEEYVGHHISEFHADGPVIEDILRGLARNEELRGYEAQLRHKDGSSRRVRIHANTFKQGGKFVHIRCFTIDVTDQRKADEARLRLAAIVDSSDDAIIGKDLNGVITSWNASAQRIFGFKPEEIVGQSILRLIPPELHYEEPGILARVRAGQRIEHFETVRLRKNGERINVSLTISPVKDEAGKVTGVAKIVRDITMQKSRDEARLRLAAIVDSSDDAIVGKDLNGIVTSWNGSAERIFGYKAEEVVGKPITLVIPPELHQDEPIILGKIRRGERIEHFETVRVRKNGERIHVSLTISPVKDEEGRAIGAAKIVRNITENKKIEEALRLNERLASVGRLAATIAHEINNPLEAVTNLLYLAKRDLSDTSRVRQHLEMADHELSRVAHITRQTLGFYRDNASPTRVDIAEALDDLLFLYGKRLSARGIEIVKQYEGKIEVNALAGEIRQVFSNLIANAIDAMHDGGSLVVRASNSHEWNNSNLPGARVVIADTGSGIEAEHKKRLFQPFFTTKKEVGTGLGLWITSGIVEKHGGTIRVRSRTEAGRSGTAFSLFLPATPLGLGEAASTLSGHARALFDSKRTSVA